MITLENEFLRVSLSDGRGARIEEYYDKKSKKNWVWKPGKRDNEMVSLGLEEGFDANWAGGWEEVFPNDAPTELENYKLVDHGEVWRRTWELDGSPTKTRASFYIRCETYPMVLRKTYALNENALVVDFEVESIASKALPYMLKFHPAIAMEEGDEFLIPESQMEQVAPGFGTIVKSEGKVPYEPGLLNKVRKNDGESREFVRFSDFEEGRFGIKSQKTGSVLRFEFSKKDFPFLWLFQSYGGFMGHFVSMIEPINARHYDLKEMHQSKSCEVIAPEEKRGHRLTLRVSRQEQERA